MRTGRGFGVGVRRLGVNRWRWACQVSATYICFGRYSGKVERVDAVGNVRRDLVLEVLELQWTAQHASELGRVQLQPRAQRDGYGVLVVSWDQLRVRDDVVDRCVGGEDLVVAIE